MSVLALHRIADQQYSIAGDITPVSIPDQIVRGRTICKMLADRKEIGANRLLCIVGGGFGGMAAAKRACELNIPSVVIDRHAEPYELQRNSDRYLHPNQYCWPADHCYDPVFPSSTDPKCSYCWTANLARNVVLQWVYAASKSPLDVDFRGQASLYVRIPGRARLKPVRIPGDLTLEQWFDPIANDQAKVFRLYVREDKLGINPLPSRVGAVLWAVGFGKEVTTVVSASSGLGASGFPFWTNDHYADDPQSKSFPDQRENARILISGGGDGGLQDYLRITTSRLGTPDGAGRSRSAIELYQSIRDACAPNHAAELAALEMRIASAEDRARRAIAWGPVGQSDHTVLETLHKAHCREVDLAVQPLKNRSSFSHAVVEGIRSIIRPTGGLPDDLRYVHVCSHFGLCYALNRFLVLAIARYLMVHLRRQTLYENTAVHEFIGQHGWRWKLS